MEELGHEEIENCDDQRLSFEEFRMMYESTERISERKLQFTKSNSSFCALIIAGQAAAASWFLAQSEIIALGLVMIGFTAILAGIFCIYWIMQLIAFKDLNAAKFEVLAEMAERIAFPDYSCAEVSSYNPFSREWQILSEKRKLRENGGQKFLRSHFSEMVVPYSFLAFFALTFVISVSWAFT